MTARIGIIAEDQSDVEVLREIFQLYGLKRLSIERFVGKGCGKIKGKCNAWARDLRALGCTRLILLHDADDHRPNVLRQELVQALGVSPIPKSVIVVAVRELEAWLLADHNAIVKSLKLRGNVKQVANPEGIRRPKEHLGELIYRASRRKLTYVNTVHNKRIAAACSINAMKRCSSFKVFDSFVLSELV